MSGETRTIDLPEDHYTLFNATRDDLPEVIVVNDALWHFLTPMFVLQQWFAELWSCGRPSECDK